MTHVVQSQSHVTFNKIWFKITHTETKRSKQKNTTLKKEFCSLPVFPEGNYKDSNSYLHPEAFLTCPFLYSPYLHHHHKNVPSFSISHVAFTPSPTELLASHLFFCVHLLRCSSIEPLLTLLSVSSLILETGKDKMKVGG